MPLIKLVCWNEDLARERVGALSREGLEIDASRLNTSAFVSQLRALQPQAVLIDLDRLPSHGREVAAAIRGSKTIRHIPIVFAGGPPEKVEKIRQELPDAVYTDWTRAAGALHKALAKPVVNPVQPISHMDRYAGSPLVKKLGIKPDMRVALIGAPEGFEEQLSDLPEGVTFRTKLDRQAGLAIWFVRSRRDLEYALELAEAGLPEKAAVWIVHPKGGSRYKVDFNQNDVRLAGLAGGLVDFKVCAVDADWSGLKFSRRKS